MGVLEGFDVCLVAWALVLWVFVLWNMEVSYLPSVSMVQMVQLDVTEAELLVCCFIDDAHFDSLAIERGLEMMAFYATQPAATILPTCPVVFIVEEQAGKVYKYSRFAASRLLPATYSLTNSFDESKLLSTWISASPSTTTSEQHVHVKR